MQKIVTFVTSNKGKAAWLDRAMKSAGISDWSAENHALDLTEIQSNDIAEISLHKARQAFALLKKPVLVMDGGCFITALNGFPGPFIRHMTDQMGVHNIAKLMGTLEDRRCQFKNVVTYMDAEDHYVQFHDTTGDVFTLSPEVWPEDHPQQWSSLWRILVPSGLGYTKPLASFDEKTLEEYAAIRAKKEDSSSLNAFVAYLGQRAEEQRPLPFRQDFVLGLAFDHDRSKMVMMRKSRPAWQAGKLNGIGGKIDPGEQPIDAMIREFHEECGVQTNKEDWHPFAKLTALDGEVICYRLFDDKILSARTCEDQEIVLQELDMNQIEAQALPSVGWLIGIALDRNQPDFFVEAKYNQNFSGGKTGD